MLEDKDCISFRWYSLIRSNVFTYIQVGYSIARYKLRVL